MTKEKLRELAYQCAGVGSGAVMREAPHVVMPEAEITAGVEQVLAELVDDVKADPVSWLEAGRETLNLCERQSLVLPPLDVAVFNALMGIGHALIDQNAILADLAERPALNSLVRKPPSTGEEPAP